MDSHAIKQVFDPRKTRFDHFYIKTIKQTKIIFN